MASGFTYAKASSILSSNITKDTYVGLSSTTPPRRAVTSRSCPRPLDTSGRSWAR